MTANRCFLGDQNPATIAGAFRSLPAFRSRRQTAQLAEDPHDTGIRYFFRIGVNRSIKGQSEHEFTRAAGTLHGTPNQL